MKTLLPDLQKDYKEFKNHPLNKYAKTNFQKKVRDEHWIKYFITCSVYEDEWKDKFEFDAQFIKDERHINVNTVSRTNDPKEMWGPYPILQEIEEMFERMRIAYWAEYMTYTKYEKSDLCK